MHGVSQPADHPCCGYADVRETFKRALLAFLIALPLTSAQLEISNWASGFTAVSACNLRRVAGILGAMCLWRIGLAVHSETCDLAYYRLDEVNCSTAACPQRYGHAMR